jgi:hypothetical protein
MSKLLAIVAGLKAILIAASVAFARGDMLSVILIPVLFNLAALGASRSVRRCRATLWWFRQATIAAADFKFTQTMRSSLNTKER